VLVKMLAISICTGDLNCYAGIPSGVSSGI